MIQWYRLNADHSVTPVDLTEGALLHEDADKRRVAYDTIGDSTVSTVFLVLDHAFHDGPPLLFETMIFGGPQDGWQYRYSTWDEAMAGHANAVQLVRQAETEVRHVE